MNFLLTEEMDTLLAAPPGRPHFPLTLPLARKGCLPFRTPSSGFPFWRLTAISHNLLYRNSFYHTALF